MLDFTLFTLTQRIYFTFSGLILSKSIDASDTFYILRDQINDLLHRP